MKTDKPVYVKWAFSDNFKQKQAHNRELFNEIKDWAIVEWRKPQYKRTLVKVRVKDGYELTDDQKALIADGGNLCFGYTKVEEDLFEINDD